MPKGHGPREKRNLPGKSMLLDGALRRACALEKTNCSRGFSEPRLQRQLALQICEHLSQSVADLKSFSVNELFHSNCQRPHRRGGLILWTQAILAVRGRDRIRSGSRACTASGPRTIRAPFAYDCAAAG